MSSFEEYNKLKSFVKGVRYGCKRCKRTYLHKKTLGRHLRFDCGNNSPTFLCELCPKRFKHGYILLRHIRIEHNIFIKNLRQRQPKNQIIF